MPTTVLRERITELRWLVDELGHELDALATTSYPRVHCFLIRTLTTRIAQVAVQVHGVLSEPTPDRSLSSTGVPLVEQSA
jgi:hypothetical protein